MYYNIQRIPTPPPDEMDEAVALDDELDQEISWRVLLENLLNQLDNFEDDN